MLAWNTTESDIRDAAAEVGLTLHSDWSGHGIETRGRALKFRLAVDSSADRDADGYLPYQRCSTSRGSRRKLAAVCWHGHRDFMRALFRRSPEMRLKTALADYRGSDDFERTYLGTDGGNATGGLGNYYHLPYGEACNCPEPVTIEERPIRFAKLEGIPPVETEVRVIPSAAIGACPFYIMVPDHYRADGSCKCDDAVERAMMIAEWEYTAADFDNIPLREESHA